MQHIAKQFVGLRPEKAESRIRRPFERHRFAAACNRGVALGLAHALRRRARPGTYAHGHSQVGIGLCFWVPGSRAAPEPRNDEYLRFPDSLLRGVTVNGGRL